MKKSRVRLGQLTIIAASIQLIFADAPPAYANPTGPQIVNGAATFQRPDSRTLNVTNAPGTIINWRGFSIGTGELTRFIQQSPSSAVLNRVVGADISQIHGQLLSNGRVFLVNPSGIVIGPGAMIDTAGFVASTLNMLDGDFLAGKLKFQGDSSSGSIINQGWIRTGYGGHVLLVAPQIENSGLIHTPGGEIILAAGKKLTITSLDLDGVQFEVQAPTDSVLNVGKLLADGGAVGVFAGSLRHSGEIRANALVYDEAGRIVLEAQNDIQIAAGSTTSADGKTGGDITVQSGGLTRVAGSVSAQGSVGQGGDIRLLGDQVAVVENALVNASGSAGGGQILVGGDFQGNNAAIQNATDTFVGTNTTLRADATQSGDGGRVIVWSDDKAQFYGSLSARGGPERGNGGFAEVSGKQSLVFAGKADLSAPNGSLGNLLLDPLDLFVFSGGGVVPSIIDENTDFPSNAATVSPATLASIVGNVTLHASRYMRISDPITLTTPGQSLTAMVETYTPPTLPDPNSLSTSVPNRLDIAADITTNGGAVSMSAPTIQALNHPVDGAPIIFTNGGSITLSSGSSAIQASQLALNAGSGAVIATSGSFLQLGAVSGGSFTATAPGFVNTGAITTSAGPVNMTSSGSSISTGNITAGSGSVSLTGAGGVFTNAIDTTGSVVLNASSGSISSTVNNASSLTASAAFNAFINSTTDINVDTVNAGAFSTASLSTSGGSILATSSSSQVTGFDVNLSSTDTGTGGGIGSAGTALNVAVQRDLSFTTNAAFNVLLNGTGPTRQLLVDLNPAHVTTGSYAGTITKSGGGLTLNASADTSTVTLNSLNVSGGFDQFSSLIRFRVPSGNLVADSVMVPVGNTTFASQLPVQLFASGNLTLNNYVRAAGGLVNTSTLTSSGGAITLGNVNAGNDTVNVTSAGGITVSSLIATGNVTLNSSAGPVNALADNLGLEITSGGTLSITAPTIGTSAFANPLDIAGAAVMLTSQNTIGGQIGFAGAPVIANTQDLTINAANPNSFNVATTAGATFNVSTGATSLTNLSVVANALAVGDTGTAQVSTANGGAVYVFDADASGNFAFNPPASTGRNVSLRSITGDITLGGTTSIGTGNFAVIANSGSILGASDITAANVSLTAQQFSSTNSTVDVGDVTATGTGGGITLKGNSAVTTGNLSAVGGITIERASNFFTPDVTVTGTMTTTTAPGTISVRGDVINVTGTVTSAENITLDAGGQLTTGGGIIGGSGSTITLNSGGVSAFGFTTINAGATGTVNITSSQGIEQTGGSGITAGTVSLLASGGSIIKTGPASLVLTGTTKLTLDANEDINIDASGTALTDLAVTMRGSLDSASINIALPVSQSVAITGSSTDFNVEASSTPALNFTLTNAAGGDIDLVGGGISTSGGNVSLTANSGSITTTTGGIATGGGSVALVTGGTGSIVNGTINAGTGSVSLTSNGGDITMGNIATTGGSILARTFAAGGDIGVNGALSAGTGSITLQSFGGGNIDGSGSATSSSFTAFTANGIIGTVAGPVPLNITAPSVSLTANRSLSATGDEGTVLATLSGTSVLTLNADRGFDVTNPGTAFTSLSVTTKGTGAGALSLTAGGGQTYSFARPATDLFGNNVANTAFEVVSVNAPTANVSFTASDGILLVRGQPGGANKIIAQNLTLAALGGGDVILQGSASDPLTLSNTNQTFSASGSASADLLLKGNVTLSASSSQTFSANGNITINADAGLLGGGGISITAPDQSFVTSGGGSKIELLGGASAGEKVTVTSTNSQTVNSASSSSDSFKLKGGSGADASVTFTHSGTGFQDFEISNGTITVEGGSGANAFARIEETGTNQQEICRHTLFFGCVPVGSIQILGGSGAGAFAELTADGSQLIRYNNALTVRGGTGDGAYALLQAGTTQQIFGGSSLTVTAGGAAQNSEPVIAAPGASAIIEGQNQFISLSGAVTLNGGAGVAGDAADALIRNLSGSQTISSGSITLNGGHTHSTTGILNMGSGAQAINGSGGILLRSDPNLPPAHVDSSVLIQNMGTGTQSLTGGLTLINSGDGAVAVTTPGNQTITANSGGVSLNANHTGSTAVTAGGNQTITARFVEIFTGAGSSGDATLSATGNQYIRTTNENVNGESMVVAALGSGMAKVESGASQLLEIGYPLIMQGPNGSGLLALGQANGVNATGNSLVQAVDQSVFAGSIHVQGPSGAAATSKLSASNVQTISTLLGGLTVTGGLGDNSLATVDPVTQTILVNGPVDVTGGDGGNADASIVSDGTQTILNTSGGMTLTAGPGAGSDAIISSFGAQNIASAGDIAVSGSAGLNADAMITTSGAQTITAGGDITLTGGSASGSDAIISNIGAQQGCALLFSCGQPQTLSPEPIFIQGAGSAIVEGGFASNSSAAGSILNADATQQTLSNMDEFDSAFDTLAPDSEELNVTRRVPICR